MIEKFNNEFLEVSNRHCPICGKFVRMGSDTHRCSKRSLNKIDKENDGDYEEEIDEIRTYDDKLQEYEEYSPDKYYDNNEE